MRNDAEKLLNENQELTSEILAEKERVEALINEAYEKALTEKKRLRAFWNNLSDLTELIRDYNRGVYHKIPWKTIAFATAAVIYFVNPLDMIPDVLPVVGLLDDATVLGFVVSAIKDDLENFRNFKTKFNHSPAGE